MLRIDRAVCRIVFSGLHVVSTLASEHQLSVLTFGRRRLYVVASKQERQLQDVGPSWSTSQNERREQAV